jgi:hypothetical protein
MSNNLSQRKTAVPVQSEDCNSPLCNEVRSHYQAPNIFWIFYCYPRNILDGSGDLNIGGQIIQTVKYAVELLLMVKEEKVLQGMIENLIEVD